MPPHLQSGAANRPPRPLGLISATSLIIASMIGTGVFTTSGFLLADLGSRGAVLAVWAAGGLVAMLGALCYGALARRLPESGGEYFFLARTLHPATGYVAGWISLLVGFSAPLAAAAVGFGEYTKSWWPAVPPRLSGTALVLACAVLHAISVRRGAWTQNAAVLVKLVLLTGFIAWGAVHLPRSGPDAAPPPVSPGAFALALVWVSFSYSGWNAAVYLASEVQNPECILPRALLLGTATVTLLYLALNAVFVFAGPIANLRGQLEVGRVAADALGGPRWADAVSLLVTLALVTSVSSLVMTGPRVYTRMAADGFLPRWLRDPSDPPRRAIALQAALALAMVWTTTYDGLLTYIGFTLSLSTAATVVGLMVLRHREGPSLRVPGWPWAPGVFVALTIAMTVLAVERRPVASLAGLATIALAWGGWKLQRTHRPGNPAQRFPA